MTGVAAANLFIGRFLFIAAHIADRCGFDAPGLLEIVFRAPKTAAGKIGF